MTVLPMNIKLNDCREAEENRTHTQNVYSYYRKLQQELIFIIYVGHYRNFKFQLIIGYVYLSVSFTLSVFPHARTLTHTQ